MEMDHIRPAPRRRLHSRRKRQPHPRHRRIPHPHAPNNDRVHHTHRIVHRRRHTPPLRRNRRRSSTPRPQAHHSTQRARPTHGQPRSAGNPRNHRTPQRHRWHRKPRLRRRGREHATHPRQQPIVPRHLHPRRTIRRRTRLMEPIRPLPKPETRRRRTRRNNRNRRTIPRRPTRQPHRHAPITRNPPLRSRHRTRRRRHHTRIRGSRQRTHHQPSIRPPARGATPRSMRRRRIRATVAAHHRPRHHRKRGRTTPGRRPHPPHPQPARQPHVGTRARGMRPTRPPGEGHTNAHRAPTKRRALHAPTQSPTNARPAHPHKQTRGHCATLRTTHMFTPKVRTHRRMELTVRRTQAQL